MAHLAIAGKEHGQKRQSVIGQIVVIAVGVQLLFFGSFMSLQLPVATQKNLTAFINNEQLAAFYLLPAHWQSRVLEHLPDVRHPRHNVRFSTYVPNIPLAVFLGYILGSTLGLISAAAFFAVGLLAPLWGVYPWAAGGGLEYWGQPGFGYLLGMVGAAWCSGWATAKRRTSFRQLLAVACGVMAAHLIGLSFLLGSCLVSLVVEGMPRFPEWRGWVFEEARNLSWYPLLYDLIFSVALLGIGAPFRWLVGTLTAADIAARPKSQQHFEELL